MRLAGRERCRSRSRCALRSAVGLWPMMVDARQCHRCKAVLGRYPAAISVGVLGLGAPGSQGPVRAGRAAAGARRAAVGAAVCRTRRGRGPAL
eukprot:208945-Prymnesium_polylepis.1